MDLGLFYQIQVPKPWDNLSESRKFQEMMEQVHPLPRKWV